MFPKMKICNSAGEEIQLSMREQLLAQYLERVMNEIGYEIDVTTLTTISKKITEQKFFEIAPADFIPVVVGEGAWGTSVETYRSFSPADDFETGIINTGGNNGRLAETQAGVDSVNQKIYNWGKSIGWTLFEVQQASKSGNWDIVTSLERSRKKNWDLGIQKIAFLGKKNDPKCQGLLNLSGVNTNTTLITEPISGMTPTELKAFCASVLDTYRSNCIRTAWPTHFVIPESDYLGLASPASDQFPIRSTLSLLEETFQIMTKNKNFKILPLAYADHQYNENDASHQTYMLLNYDEETFKMGIPVDYTNTLANSTDNFHFQNVAYGQFTGVVTLRPKELLYYKYSV